MYSASPYFCNGLGAVTITSDPRTVLCLLRKVIAISSSVKFQVIFNLVASSRYLLFCNSFRLLPSFIDWIPVEYPDCWWFSAVSCPTPSAFDWILLGYPFCWWLSAVSLRHTPSREYPDCWWFSAKLLSCPPHPYFFLSSIPIVVGSRLDYTVLPHPLGFWLNSSWVSLLLMILSCLFAIEMKASTTMLTNY